MEAETRIPPSLREQLKAASRKRDELRWRAEQPFWVVAMVIGVGGTGLLGERLGLEGSPLFLLQMVVTVPVLLLLPWLGRKFWPERFEFEQDGDA